MNKSKYRFIFSILNVVAIGIIVLFMGFLFFQLKTIILEATLKKDNTLKVTDKDIANNNPEKQIVINAQEQDVVVVGEKNAELQKAPFEWPDENTLIKEALNLFQQKSNWEACLYLTSIQGRDKINEQNVYDYINQFYRKIMAEALHQELLKIGRKPEKKIVNMKDLFESLTMPETLVMVNNIYVYLRTHSVPRDIADIIIKFFLLQVQDPFLKIVVFDLLDKEPKADVAYFDAERFSEKCFGLKDKKYLEMYMQQCLLDLWQSWNRVGGSTSRWIIGYKTNVDEKNALKKAADAESKYLKEREYNRLSAFHKYLLANYAIRSIKNQTQLDFFSKYGYWTQAVEEDKDKYKKLVTSLRQNPRWNYLLNRQHYKKALPAISSDYHAMTLKQLPDDLRTRLDKMVDIEKELWYDNVDKNSWKNMVFSKTKGGKKYLSKKLFWKCLYKIFPKLTRTESQNALIAACMINRGFNPSVFANLGINDNIIEKYIPPEEFDDKK